MFSLRDGMTRREFLRAGALSLFGASLPLPKLEQLQDRDVVRPRRAMNCILLLLTGGPGHLDTWDLKPEAPREFRGPFVPIRTNVPGIHISEIFPRMARHADKFAILRAVYSSFPAIHPPCRSHGTFFLPETGLYLEDAERLRSVADGSIRTFEGERNSRSSDDSVYRDYARLSSARAREAFDLRRESTATRAKYGWNRFGQSCLLARRLVERGVPFVTVPMFDALLDPVTWDAHGAAPFPCLEAYRTLCGPWFDNGYSSLIEDLHALGLYDHTVVVAMGEFGRTPKLNASGGRDHWPHCWSVILGGGGIRGGQVIGASDSIGAYPADRPVSLVELIATLRHLLGIDSAGALPFGSSHLPPDMHAAKPIPELL